MPPRFTADPRSVPGDFYVIQNECMGCGIPQKIAPELVNWVESSPQHCGWVRQPASKKDLKRAIEILKQQDFGCHRYAGMDPRVLQSVPECCDYFVQPGVDMPQPRVSWWRRILKRLISGS
ncbi:hypothetical protein FTW19_25160 [Terriglobus albidus]|uniref:Uncharacterized protein n=1 Tax=Terriglobus albidus TaxID=1592106 RepID=A0A5B9EG49_9BACT|nr:hypothetical protein [Terriglobus albidus]QEE31002.1 hypothetical protein FTW19_25160 [Terriglobus albidus]